MAELKHESVLPELRSDLKVKPGIRELDGSKTWTIFDPLRHLYFQIDYKSLQILKIWGKCSAGEITEQLHELSVTLDDIETLLRFLWQNSLTVMPPNNDIDFLLNNSKAKTAKPCLLYTSPSPRDGLLSRMPSSA